MVTEIKDIYQELQEVRYELSRANLNKSGHNKHLGFDYFELADFLPTATKLLNNHKITPVFRIDIEDNGIEYAYLTMIKGNEQVMFKTPTANPQSSNNPIQMLGSKITYMRRYLYLIALDIIENDSVDPAIERNEKNDSDTVVCTPGQVATIKANGKLIAKELADLGIKTVNDMQSLSKLKASELVGLIKERKASEESKVS